MEFCIHQCSIHAAVHLRSDACKNVSWAYARPHGAMHCSDCRFIPKLRDIYEAHMLTAGSAPLEIVLCSLDTKQASNTVGHDWVDAGRKWPMPRSHKLQCFCPLLLYSRNILTSSTLPCLGGLYHMGLLRLKSYQNGSKSLLPCE